MKDTYCQGTITPWHALDRLNDDFKKLKYTKLGTLFDS